MSAGLFQQISTNIDGTNKKLDIFMSKVVAPIRKGEVIDISIGSPQSYEEFMDTGYCGRDKIVSNFRFKHRDSYFDERYWGQSILCGELKGSVYNKQRTVLIPVSFSLKEDFKVNIQNIMDSISDDKSVNDSGFKSMDDIVGRKPEHYVIRFLDYKPGKNTKTTDYLLKNVGRSLRASGRSIESIGSNSFNVTLLDKDSNVVLFEKHRQIGFDTQTSFYSNSNKNNKIHLFTVDTRGPYFGRYGLVLPRRKYGYIDSQHIREFTSGDLIEFQRYFVLVLDIDPEILRQIQSLIVEFV